MGDENEEVVSEEKPGCLTQIIVGVVAAVLGFLLVLLFDRLLTREFPNFHLSDTLAIFCWILAIQFLYWLLIRSKWIRTLIVACTLTIGSCSGADLLLEDQWPEYCAEEIYQTEFDRAIGSMARKGIDADDAYDLAAKALVDVCVEGEWTTNPAQHFHQALKWDVIDLRRQNQRCATAFNRFLDVSPAPKSVDTEIENKELVMSMMCALKPVDQQILLMAHVEEMTDGEIAQKLGSSSAAIKKRRQRAIKAIESAHNASQKKGN